MKYLFIIDYLYIGDVKTYLSAHIDWLNEQYMKGLFIASGRKEPYVGGVIITRGDNINQIYELLTTDPFVINRVVVPNVIQFEPSKLFIENMMDE